MVGHDDTNVRWRNLQIVGRMGFALCGGGLFAFLAWNPTPNTKHDENNKHRKEVLAAVGMTAADLEVASARALMNAPARYTTPEAWGTAAIRTGQRSEFPSDPTLEDDTAAADKDDLWIIATAEGRINETWVKHSRGPP